jgi:transketolase
MRIDPQNPEWPNRDRFIPSLGSIDQRHPDLRFLPSLEASMGSLGEGLALALGVGLVNLALLKAETTKRRPTCIVAHTLKRKGVSFMENNPKFHGTAPTTKEVGLALQELQ